MLQPCKALFWVSCREEIMFLVQAGSPLRFLLLFLVHSLLSNWVCHAGKAKPFRTVPCSRQRDFTAGLSTLAADK